MGGIKTFSIIKKSIQLTWKNKLFWLLGIFAFIISPAGEIESILTSGANASQPGILSELRATIIDSKILTLTGLKGLTTSIINQPVFTLTVLFFLLLSIIIFAAIIWFAVVCHITLIYRTAQLEKSGKDRPVLSFKAGFKKFWPVLILNLIFKVIFVFLFFIIGLLLAKHFLLLTILFVIFSIIIISASFITKIAVTGLVLENLKIKTAYQQAVSLFVKYWFTALKLMFGLLAVNIVLVVILTLASAFLDVITSWAIKTVPLLKSAAGFSLSVNSLLIFDFILKLLVLGVATAVYWVGWTLLYIKLKISNQKSA